MYKIFVKTILGKKVVGKGCVCKDFDSLTEAVVNIQNYLVTPESTYRVRFYDERRNNIISDDEQDTGTIVINYRDEDLSLSKIVSMCGIIRDHDNKICMLTNRYKVGGVDLFQAMYEESIGYQGAVKRLFKAAEEPECLRSEIEENYEVEKKKIINVYGKNTLYALLKITSMLCTEDINYAAEAMKRYGIDYRFERFEQYGDNVEKLIVSFIKCLAITYYNAKDNAKSVAADYLRKFSKSMEEKKLPYNNHAYTENQYKDSTLQNCKNGSNVWKVVGTGNLEGSLYALCTSEAKAVKAVQVLTENYPDLAGKLKVNSCKHKMDVVAIHGGELQL